MDMAILRRLLVSSDATISTKLVMLQQESISDILARYSHVSERKVIEFI